MSYNWGIWVTDSRWNSLEWTREVVSRLLCLCRPHLWTYRLFFPSSTTLSGRHLQGHPVRQLSWTSGRPPFLWFLVRRRHAAWASLSRLAQSPFLWFPCPSSAPGTPPEPRCLVGTVCLSRTGTQMQCCASCAVPETLWVVRCILACFFVSVYFSFNWPDRLTWTCVFPRQLTCHFIINFVIFFKLTTFDVSLLRYKYLLF